MESNDFEKAMSLFGALSNDKNDIDVFSLLDMFTPQKKTMNSPNNKHNLFENKYEETNDIKCLKTSVPYLQYNHQKNILLMIKIMEIKKLIEIYNDNNDIKKCTKDDMLGLLDEMTLNLDEGKQDEIKKYLKLVDLCERIK